MADQVDVRLSDGLAAGELALVRDVLAALDDDGIQWCHWKSNEHVLAGLRGETDLDLLVSPEAEQSCERILRQHGYLEAVNPRLRRIPGLRDYLGLDVETGTVSHLHVHHRLVLGERHVKEHHLPLEDWLLSGDERRHGVRVPRPEQELVLLYIRAILKSDTLAGLRDRFRGRSPVPQAIRDEIAHLASRTSDDAVVEALRESGLPLHPADLRDFLRRARQNRLDAAYLRRAKGDLLDRLRPFERHSRPVASVRRVGYRVRFDSRAQRLLRVRRKRLAGKGLYIAIVGADGSGKSRLAADLVPWLSRKLDVLPLYFGQPKGHATWRGIRRVRRLIASAPATDGRDTWIDRWDTGTWLYLALRRRRLDLTARRHRNRGGVALAERFPLPEFRDMALPMDGPRLAGRGRVSVASRLEARCYEAIRRPDLVIALVADLDLLRRRKPETDAVEHIGKADALLQLRPRPGLVVIEAAQPYSEVLLAAKRAIREALLDGTPLEGTPANRKPGS
ncbi:MAG TPA: hypothetical protein VFX33_00855 [Actinomycetales bacterium]|nr:hypothetical protein [Actinomycetales bacterium]